jgi:hypothetical protein
MNLDIVWTNTDLLDRITQQECPVHLIKTLPHGHTPIDFEGEGYAFLSAFRFYLWQDLSAGLQHLTQPNTHLGIARLVP